MELSDWSIIILAGGRGERLIGLGPKPLVRLGGRALVEPILTLAAELVPSRTVVVVSETTASVAERYADPRRAFVRVGPVGTSAEGNCRGALCRKR